MRRLMTALFPTLLCLLCCILFQWLDTVIQAGGFFLFLCKGLLLGCVAGLLLPVAGISARNNGLIPWLFVAAGLLALLLLYQYLETQQIVNWPALNALIAINGHAILAEGTVAGFLLLTAIINRRK